MSIDFEEDVINSLEVLRKGGLILYPTDTIWGIGCDATNPYAIQKIYNLKKRDLNKSMIVLVAGKQDILRYVAAPDPAVFHFLSMQDRPTTLIFEGAIGLPENLVAEDGSLGFRIVQEIFCRHLIKRLGKPLVSTSANLSGAPSPQCFSDISQDIINGVNYAVHYRRQESSETTPSQVIKFKGNGQYDVIRE